MYQQVMIWVFFALFGNVSFRQKFSFFRGPRSVAAKFEVTAYSKLAPAKISNLCIFEYTYVYSNIHGHFVDDYRIWTPFDSCPVNSKLWVSRIFEVMGFVTI
jgi:hypothetical protein